MRAMFFQKMVALAALALMASWSLSLRAQSSPQAQFERARLLEENSATLNEAIGIYRQVATQAGSNRALAAQALLRLAESYQKQGDAQARGVYEELVRTYGDQPAAVTARARLGTTTSPAVVRGDRAVWTGPDVDLFGSVSPDGRYLTYVDWRGAQNLMLRDFTTNTSRSLTGNRTPGEHGTADFSAISRDGTQVAFWMGGFRIASLTSPGVPTSRLIASGEYLRPMNWSPDAKSVAVLVRDQQLGVINVSDGVVRRLKWTDWRTVDNVVFSPDGQFLAYDIESPGRQGCRGILVMAVDAQRETAVTGDEHCNYLMGWSAAGDILFTSDRSGTRALWAVRIKDGDAVGAPRLVKPDVRATLSLGLTASGTLFVHQQASPGEIRIMAFDSVNGLISSADSERGAFHHFIEQHGHPRWSADGRFLMFFSCGVRNWPCELFIQDTVAGALRKVPHEMRYISFADLAPDAHAIVVNGSDVKGRKGIFTIDATTGTTSLLVGRGVPDHRDPVWTGDGRAIRYSEARGDELVLVERQVVGDTAKDIFKIRKEGVSRMELSPDGQRVGYIRRVNGGNQDVYSFAAVDIVSGATKEYKNPGGTPDVFFWHWMNDSQTVILQRHVSDAVELWRLSAVGEPQKLPFDGRTWETASVAPDGGRVAIERRIGSPGNEVWALENFLPPTPAAGR